MKTAVIVLTVVTLGLAAGLLVEHRQATQAVKSAQDDRNSYSNSWQETKVKLEEAQKVGAALEGKLNLSTEALTAASNTLAKTSTDLAQANSDLTKVQADFASAQAEVKKQQGQIAALETQRDDLTKKMDELTASITSLEGKIDDTKKKLASSEGDRNFLLKELDRMQNEKAALVAQFNNLATLRAQVAKLKEEAAINQRLAWIRMGVYEQREKKGAERLLAATPAPSKPDSRLEIELEQNGRGKIAPRPVTTPPGQ